jgi:type II secretion system protein G
LSRFLPLLDLIVFGSIVYVGAFMDVPQDRDRRLQLEANAEIRKLMKALERYSADCGKYPSAAEGLDALNHGAGVSGWRGPYLQDNLINDPWGRRFVYRPNSLSPEVVSYGADGAPGGESFGSDISSRRLWAVSPASATEIRAGRIMLGMWLGACAGLLARVYLLWINGRRNRRRIPTPQ